jgi:hypothetical protein
MNFSPLLLTFLHGKASRLKQQSQKRSLMATCTGLGALASVMVGVLLKQVLGQPDAFSWGTVVSSFVLIPASLLLGSFLWDSLRIKWLKSDELIYQLKFLEDEYLRNLQIIEKSGMAEDALKESKKELYFNFRRAQSQVVRQQFLERDKKGNLTPFLTD